MQKLSSQPSFKSEEDESLQVVEPPGCMNSFWVQFRRKIKPMCVMAIILLMCISSFLVMWSWGNRKAATALTEEYVAICTAVKDQSLDLPEWFIHHYHHLGIRRFYIMDDGSLPPLSEFHDYGIDPSTITFTYFTPEERKEHLETSFQTYMYNECSRRFGVYHTWMAFIDADEMLEMKSNETFSSFLQTFENQSHVGAVAVQWQVHTSSGILTRPSSCRKAFITCSNDQDTGVNACIKSIVRTKYYDRPAGDPHHFVLLDGSKTVGEDGDIVDGWSRNPITRNRIALHHYMIKSKEEYAEKIKRGNADDNPRAWDFWNLTEYGSELVNCTSMAMYEP